MLSALGGGDVQEFRVLATAGEAYRFLFRELGTILRLCWLPLLLVTVIQIVATILLIGQHDLFDDTFAFFTSPAALAGWTIRVFVSVIGTSIAAVALHRVILFGEYHSGQFAYLHFGRTEWLFMLLPLAFYAVVAAMTLALFLPVWIFAVLFPLSLAIIYLITRFSLIFPVTVMKGRYDFDEVRAVSRGRFWRLFVLWLLVLLPAAFVYSALQRLVTFGALSVDPDLMAHIVIDTPTLIAMSVLQWIAKIIFVALGVAALSYAYKALTGRFADEILTPQS